MGSRLMSRHPDVCQSLATCVTLKDAMPSTTITIKSRPRKDGSVRWFLWVRTPEGQDDRFIDAPPHLTKAEDRPAVDEWAKPFRAALGKIKAEPKAETASEWYDRFVKTRMGKVSTASRDHQQWLKWIAPVSVRDGARTFGALAMVDVGPDDIEAVRDALNGHVEAWEGAEKTRGVGMSYATAGNVWAI